MTHDPSDRPAPFVAEQAAPVAHFMLEWDDPAISPFEVGVGGSHPLFVSGADRPLDWEPSTPHRLVSPLTDGAGNRSLR
jgi:hypothetical protein